jgi:thioredoxin 1
VIDDTESAGGTEDREDATGAAGEPVQVREPSDLDRLVSEHDVALVDFYADWCGPCKMLEPTVAELAAETPAAVLKVDIDQHRELAGRFQVQGVPTLYLFADGEPVERLVGVRGKEEYARLIQQYA